jgi:hypothetical protein
MTGRFALLLAVLTLAVLPATTAARAQPARGSPAPAIISPGPDRVAVTVYRDPGRRDGAFNLAWLEGYALVSETRTVTIPAGESDLRFEGVAGGILPQSAIVSGLPDGIVERNRDAYLLSPGTLYDRSLGGRVQLRRTSRATGTVREQEAVIRSSLDGGVVLETAGGIETLRCTGLAETLVYPSLPLGLAARPTLSVRIRAARAVTVTVTLSYLASGFDWEAFYIATLSADGESADLFAWLTLANGDETGFAEAQVSAVAGRLAREDTRPPPVETRPLTLDCWPSGTTSDGLAGDSLASLPRLRAPPPPPPPPPAMAESIIVTGSRIPLQAELEALADVKLYRIPEPVTLAARSQKQVNLLHQPRVQVRTVYRHRFPAMADFTPVPARRYLVARNRAADGLGLPLPAGRLALFAVREGRPILLGEGAVADRAVGEDVEVELDEAPAIQATLRRPSAAPGDDDGSGEYELLVTSDSPRPLRYEAEILDRGVTFRSNARLISRNGRRVWAVTIPPNGTVRLRYRVAR